MAVVHNEPVVPLSEQEVIYGHRLPPGKRRSMPPIKTRAAVIMEQVKRNPDYAAQAVGAIAPKTVHTEESLQSVAARGGAQMDGEFLPGIVQYTGQPLVPVWKKDGHGGWARRMITIGNLAIALDNGSELVCPACGADCGDRINACPAQPKRHFTNCPICRKPLLDPGEGYGEADEVEDEMRIQITDLGSTPRQRLMHRLREHMMAIHPSEAVLHGITPNPPRPEEPATRFAQPTFVNPREDEDEKPSRYGART